LEKGLVIKSTGSRYRVITPSGEITECIIRGKFREKGTRVTNPVAVGDNVLFTPSGNMDASVITAILDRKNYILRKSSNLSRESQIIASNVDRVFLMVTIVLPETQAEFIDRFLITAEAYRIPASIIINKTDLYSEEEKTRMENLISVYTRVGYECFRVSVAGKTGLGAPLEKMKESTSLLAGNSGVGKTSFINALNPGLNLKTGEVSSYHKQGKHVTTFPEMHRLPSGGFIIDSPGIRGFGVVDMDKNEIYHFFPEIFRVSERCRFTNCLHLDEPGCAVREAIDTGEISLSRYRSYVNIMTDEDRKYR
jgi:ribosome biogenesis GTPase